MDQFKLWAKFYTYDGPFFRDVSLVSLVECWLSQMTCSYWSKMSGISFLLFLGCLSRRMFATKRRIAAAVSIQKHVRRWLLRRTFLQVYSAVVVIQSSIRSSIGRQRYVCIKEHRAAVFIQVLSHHVDIILHKGFWCLILVLADYAKWLFISIRLLSHVSWFGQIYISEASESYNHNLLGQPLLYNWVTLFFVVFNTSSGLTYNLNISWLGA